MKKYLFLLVLAVLWGCQERSIVPSSSESLDGATGYGSSVVSLPGLAGLSGLGKVARGATYKFVLTITGSGLEQMTISIPLGTNDTAITIEQIPAGKSRLFTGTLYGPEGPTHEGRAYADIYPGKIAYVRLYLRKTGAAQVEVIIEGVNENTVSDCYQLEGQLDSLLLEGYFLKMMQASKSDLSGILIKNEQKVGRFYAQLSSLDFTGKISLVNAPDVRGGHVTGTIFINGSFTSDFSMFKSLVFSLNDTTEPAGFIAGNSVPCDLIKIDTTARDTITTPVEIPSGCFKLEGVIGSLPLDEYTVKFLESKNNQFWTYLYKGTELTGKFWGTVNGRIINGEISIPDLPEGIARFNGEFTDDYQYFKGEVYSMNDPTLRPMGRLSAAAVPCDDIISQKECMTDTLIVDASCTDKEILKKYAEETCDYLGLSLTGFYPLRPCTEDNGDTSTAICVECCRP